MLGSSSKIVGKKQLLLDLLKLILVELSTLMCLKAKLILVG